MSVRRDSATVDHFQVKYRTPLHYYHYNCCAYCLIFRSFLGMWGDVTHLCCQLLATKRWNCVQFAVAYSTNSQLLSILLSNVSNTANVILYSSREKLRSGQNRASIYTFLPRGGGEGKGRGNTLKIEACQVPSLWNTLLYKILPTTGVMVEFFVMF